MRITNPRAVRAAGILLAAGLACGVAGATAAQATPAGGASGASQGGGGLSGGGASGASQGGGGGGGLSGGGASGASQGGGGGGGLSGGGQSGASQGGGGGGGLSGGGQSGASQGGQNSSAGKLVLCSGGSYASSVVVNKVPSAKVAQGQCSTFALSGHGSVKVAIYGYSGGHSFLISTDSFDISQGEGIRTLGTGPDDNDWTTF